MNRKKGSMDLSHRFNPSLKINRQLAITQSLKQALLLLQMPQVELSQWILEEIEQNPLLELLEHPSGYRASKEYPIHWIAASPSSVEEEISAQIREHFKTLQDQQLAEKIVNCVDEQGFLSHTTRELASRLNEPVSCIESIVSILKTFEPPGIFSQNLQEYLLTQLHAQGKQTHVLSCILKDHFDAFIQGHLKKLRHLFSQKSLEQALLQFFRLSRNPRQSFHQEQPLLIIPDLELMKENGHWKASVLETELPQFKKKSCYVFDTPLPKEEKETLQSWNLRANWLFRSLGRRKKLLKKVGQLLIETQKGFLEDTHNLHPFTLKEAAQQLHIHESTLSRAIAEKYVSTPKGIFPIRLFLTTASKKQFVHTVLKNLLLQKQEPHLSDAKLVKKLQELGVHLSRRTVTKYRHQLQITSSLERDYF